MKEIVFKSVKEAGKILLEYYNKIETSHIDAKSDNDFVTFVDRESEKKIVTILKENFPSYHIMAEEEEWDNNSDEMQWIIDPLDGTNNYIHGFPVFAVVIALEVKKEIVLGVVYDPVRNEIFWSEKGKGAYLNDKKLKASENSILKKTLVATGFPFRWREYEAVYMKCFKNVFDNVSDIRRTGSAALDICYTACGRLDAYWEFGLSPWDIAAGSLIALEGGAVITDFKGGDNHIYSGNVLVANKHVHEDLLNIIKQYDWTLKK